MGLTAANIYENTATLQWQKSGPGSFNVQYRPVNVANWTTVTTNKNTYALTNLSCGTDYYFRVQSVCSDTSQSLYAANTAFSTLACNSNCGLLPSRWSSQDIAIPLSPVLPVIQMEYLHLRLLVMIYGYC